jgi:hypothetical protein
MERPVRLPQQLLVVCMVLLTGTAQLEGQDRPEPTLFRTRRWLDSAATAVERQASSAKGDSRVALESEAKAMRQRLSIGDFYPGDQVVVELYGGEEPIRDTLSVRSGQELIIGRYPPFTVKGLLRSELDSALTVQLRRYLTQPQVRTTPLARILVTGGVARPGYLTVRSDLSVTDVVTRAGGLTPVSLVNKSQVRRADERVIEQDSMSVVLQTGMTIDQADIRAGDEIRIGEKRQTNWLNLVFTFSILIGTVTTIIALVRG